MNDVHFNALNTVNDVHNIDAKEKHLRKSPAEIKILAIQATKTSIHNSGVSGVNARHIAKSIGCSVGTLYNHFKNIDHLILEANLNTLSALDRQLKQALLQGLSPEKSIQAIAFTYIDFSLEQTNAWQTLFEHQMPKDSEVPQSYYQQRKQLFHYIEQPLSAIHPNLSPDKLALESRALWAGIHGICVLAINNKLDDDNLNLKEIAQTLIQHFLNTQGETTCNS